MVRLKKRSKLANIRHAKGMLQKDVAKAAGVTRAFYTQVENGTRTPSMQVAKFMADALGLSLDEFFYILGVTERNTDEQAATSEAASM